MFFRKLKFAKSARCAKNIYPFFRNTDKIDTNKEKLLSIMNHEAVLPLKDNPLVSLLALGLQALRKF